MNSGSLAQGPSFKPLLMVGPRPLLQKTCDVTFGQRSSGTTAQSKVTVRPLGKEGQGELVNLATVRKSYVQVKSA